MSYKLKIVSFFVQVEGIYVVDEIEFFLSWSLGRSRRVVPKICFNIEHEKSSTMLGRVHLVVISC